MIDYNKMIFEIARVVNVEDIFGGDRIQARTFNDRTTANDQIPFAFPLLPKHLYIKPKIGEYVIILAYDDAHRFFIGPIIPQLNKLEIEDTLYAKSFFDEGIVAPNINPEYVRNSDGVFPKADEIALMGRKNTDIIFKDDEVWIRAGKYNEVGGNKVFSLNPTYIKIKHDLETNFYTNRAGENIEYKTTATFVADEINLISSSNKAKQLFKVNDPNDMITDIELQNILEKAYRLPYGDILAEILLDTLNFAVTHVHNGNLAPPSLSPETVELIAQIRNKINTKLLSNNIRIN